MEPEAANDRVDDGLASGVKRDRIEVGCWTDEAVDEGREVRLKEAGELARHHHPKSVISALVAQRLGARRHQLMTGPADPDSSRALATTQNCGAGTIAENEDAQQVVGGRVGWSERERRHLDGDDKRRLAGIRSHPVGRPGERRRTPGTTEVHERHAADVAAQTQVVDQLHVHPGEDEPGT